MIDFDSIEFGWQASLLTSVCWHRFSLPRPTLLFSSPMFLLTRDCAMINFLRKSSCRCAAANPYGTSHIRTESLKQTRILRQTCRLVDEAAQYPIKVLEEGLGRFDGKIANSSSLSVETPLAPISINLLYTRD